MAPDDQKYIDSAKMAVSWISDKQLACGGFPSYFSNGAFGEETSPDMTAQVLRLWLMLKEGERPEIDYNAAITSILNLQSKIDQTETHGGIAAGDAWFKDLNKNVDFSGKHINSWVSMFSAQAIRMTSDPLPEPYFLI